MTADVFKEKYGYEIDGVWLPRVTAITSFSKSQRFTSSKFFATKNGWGEAAQWGIATHEIIERILHGEEVHIEARIAITIEAFQRWQQDNAVTLVDSDHSIEERVFDLRHGYAGTVDIVARVNGDVGIIDVKTSASISREYSLQTAAYLNAYNTTCRKEDSCEKRWILRIDQYQECVGCFAKLREKYVNAQPTGGNPQCNHQWGESKGEVEFRELENYEKDMGDFLLLKDRWEQYHKEWLSQISNYYKNIRQYRLL